MECRVLNVGMNDLGAGATFLRELEEHAEFPFISSSIMMANSEQLAFEPYLIIRSGNLKLGFIGVTIGNKQAKEFTYKDPVEAAKQVLSDIRDKVDLVFLLANVDDATEAELTREVTGVDFLIRSKSRSLYRNPKKQDGVIVIRNGAQGKYAGILKIRRMNRDEELTNISSQYVRIKFTENRLHAMEANLKEGETLEEHYAGDKIRLQLIERLRAEKKKNEELIANLPNSFFFEAIPLNAKIPDAPEIAPIVEEYMPEASKH